VCFEKVLALQCHVIRYRSNWSNKGEVIVGTKEPVKCLKSEPFLKSFALIIRVDNIFICNIKTILTFWVYTKKINFVYILIRYWRPNCSFSWFSISCGSHNHSTLVAESLNTLGSKSFFTPLETAPEYFTPQSSPVRNSRHHVQPKAILLKWIKLKGLNLLNWNRKKDKQSLILTVVLSIIKFLNSTKL